MNSELVKITVADGVAQIALNRPKQRNAVNAAMTRALSAAFDRVEQDDAIRVVVLAGNGPVFCSGMDLNSFTGGEAEDILFGPHGFAGVAKRQRRKPVIAAVLGAALAGGFELALACDMIVAGQSAVFGLPEVKLGLIAGGGGAMRLAQRVPRALANELILTGKPYAAAEMQRWGVVNRVVPDADVATAAAELGAEIAANAPLSVQNSLALSDRLFQSDDAENWPHSDARLRALSHSADVSEGIAAFFDKRPPDWQGR